MQTKNDRKGNSVSNGSRVKWVKAKVRFTTEDHKNGYKDVDSGPGVKS